MEKIAGPGGIECHEINHESGAKLIVARHGGHAVSWKTADGEEQLFLSPTADYSPDKAIRGGVPVIFPQFSDHGPFGRHGFARKSEWDVVPGEDSFSLATSLESHEAWPHPFSLKLHFDLGSDCLTMSLTVNNPGDAPFAFHAALHTYLRTNGLSETQVLGLESRDFLDEATGEMKTGSASPITFGKEVDRAYFDAAKDSVLLKTGNKSLRIDSKEFPDLVIWNPGPDHGIGDLTCEGWRQFVCIESARVKTLLPLDPGQSWTAKQTITISSAL
ncbi:MAG: D-hexose-6-phosphate mutarotase [Verrucomicrobiales bacterium]|nr:D-hexose-6-phosphate mutarotase [Verrucomicrobiales bacterium]